MMKRPFQTTTTTTTSADPDSNKKVDIDETNDEISHQYEVKISKEEDPVKKAGHKVDQAEVKKARLEGKNVVNAPPVKQREVRLELYKAELNLQKVELERDLAEVKAELAKAETKNDQDKVKQLEEKKEAVDKELQNFKGSALKQELAKKKQELEREYPDSEGRVHNILPDLRKKILDHPPLEEIPKIEDLDKIITANLSATIPVEAHVFKNLQGRVKDESGESALDKLFLRQSSTETCDSLELPILYILSYNIADKVKNGNEAMVHCVYDILIGQVLSIFLVGETINIARNETEKTSIKGSRPDFLMTMRKVLVFRGEEKKHGDNLEDPSKELLEKMNRKWNPAVLGRIPFIFGYAACGTRIRVFVLYPTAGSNKYSLNVIKKQIGRDLDVSNVLDALELIKYIINLCRILKLLIPTFPSNPPPLNERWIRASGINSVIKICDEYVEKTIRVNVEEGYYHKWTGGLQKLYALISQGHIINTIKLIEAIPNYDESEVVLKLYPLGYREEPQTLEELKFCLSNVLKALKSMHDNRWVHRDVKFANIVHCLDTTWMLIDLELALELDENGEADWPSWARSDYPMPQRLKDEKGEEEKWKPKHDIQHVAIMLNSLSFFKNDAARYQSLVDGFMNSSTCDEALDCLNGIL